MKRTGVYLGTNERTEESLIGTNKGVVRARTVRRLTETERWDHEMINNIRGTPKYPRPGSHSHRIPAHIQEEDEGSSSADSQSDSTESSEFNLIWQKNSIGENRGL